MSDTSNTKKMGRRDFLRAASMAAGATVLAACAPQATQAPQSAAATTAPGNAPAAADVVKLRGSGSMSIDILNKLIEAINLI